MKKRSRKCLQMTNNQNIFPRLITYLNIVITCIMFNFIIHFFNKNPQAQAQTQTQHQNYIFSEQYRRSYNKLWINKLRTYSPK